MTHLAASERVPVRNQTLLHPPYFVTEVSAPRIASQVRPGQFVMVRHPGVGDPLLGRPFSVFDVDGDGVQLLYHVVGRGTQLLASRQRGDSILLLGPLGRGFDMAAPGERALLIAGGIGIAAFPLLARELVARGVETRLFYGARSKPDLVTRDRFTALGVEVREATDDGSAGHHGFVTDLLARELEAGATGLRIYACGPTPMLRRVRELALRACVACELALESHMGCGFGVCLGCVVPAAAPATGYKLICRDGPCFSATEVEP